MPAAPTPLIDGFGRRISYVRLSVTDRCDLRCTYCMPERMTFLPRAELLTIDELLVLADALIARGVSRIRLTGGEPLVRRGVEQLIGTLGARVGGGLDELTLTTNGTQLARFAPLLAKAGVRRVNVSLDSLDPDRFAKVTRGGVLGTVLDGIAEAQAAGLRVKINTVALKGVNEDEIPALLDWCVREGHDLTLIETMPLGAVDGRADGYQALDAVMRGLEVRWALVPSLARTGGPARYYEVAGTGTRLGLITPISRNFCSGCNRVRVTATGRLYGCLGHEEHVELRDLLREGGPGAVDAALDRLIARKPERHRFDIAAAEPAVPRTMSVTGG